MNCDEATALLEAYALVTLDPAERADVELHLAGCSSCRKTAAEYAEVAALLPHALAIASPLAPPASLKRRLFAAIDDGAAPPSRPRIEAPALPLQTAEDRLASGRRRPAWLSPRILTAAAASVIVALLLVRSVQLSMALTRERTQRAELASLVGQQETVLEIVDSNKTVKAMLRPPESGSPAYGKLYTRPDLPNVVLMAARLPQPPPDQAYHVWLTTRGQTRLAGTLTTNDQGFGLLVFREDRNGPVYDAAQLILQPEGSTAPTGTPILTWQAPR